MKNAVFVFLIILFFLCLVFGIQRNDYKDILTVILALPGLIALWVTLTQGPKISVDHLYANPIEEHVVGQNFDVQTGFKINLVLQNSGSEMTTVKSAFLSIKGREEKFTPINYSDATLFERHQKLDSLAPGEAKSLRLIFTDRQLFELKQGTKVSLELAFVKHKNLTLDLASGLPEFHDQYEDLPHP